MVAAARAIASKEPNALIDDPFAEPLVRAVGLDFFVRLLDGEFGQSDDDGGDATRLIVNVMAVRTRFFDDFFNEAAAAGIRQAVILASGLDARLPAGLAGRHRRVRDRPAQGDRVQERDDGVDRCRADGGSPCGQHRPPR
jgi:hypothetical protein